MKHQELIDFCTEQNKKIIENNLDKENLIDIDEIKFFSIKNNTSKEPFSLSDEEDIDFNFDKINLVLSLNCLKEEFPKEFFIDYILDEAYTERGKTSKLKINKNESLRKPSAQNLVYENEEFKTNYNKIAEKICQLFDIKDKEDINMIKTYINEILKIDKNLRNYFEKNMNKYRFAPFEKFEQEKYDEKIKSCFEKHKEEIQNLSKLNDSIISYQAFDEFLNRCLNEEDKENEFIFYIMSLMKLSKNERKAEKNERLKALKLFEFNLKPFYEKIIKQ
jgi:Zn-dependent M32 family carboxypeptidase